MAKAILTTKVDPTYDDLPDTVTRLINRERRPLVPSRPDERPHSQFLQFHRRQVFKG